VPPLLASHGLDALPALLDTAAYDALRHSTHGDANPRCTAGLAPYIHHHHDGDGDGDAQLELPLMSPPPLAGVAVRFDTRTAQLACAEGSALGSAAAMIRGVRKAFGLPEGTPFVLRTADGCIVPPGPGCASYRGADTSPLTVERVAAVPPASYAAYHDVTLRPPPPPPTATATTTADNNAGSPHGAAAAAASGAATVVLHWLQEPPHSGCSWLTAGGRDLALGRWPAAPSPSPTDVSSPRSPPSAGHHNFFWPPPMVGVSVAAAEAPGGGGGDLDELLARCRRARVTLWTASFREVTEHLHAGPLEVEVVARPSPREGGAEGEGEGDRHSITLRWPAMGVTELAHNVRGCGAPEMVRTANCHRGGRGGRGCFHLRVEVPGGLPGEASGGGQAAINSGGAGGCLWLTSRATGRPAPLVLKHRKCARSGRWRQRAIGPFADHSRCAAAGSHICALTGAKLCVEAEEHRQRCNHYRGGVAGKGARAAAKRASSGDGGGGDGGGGGGSREDSPHKRPRAVPP
jgi:hypothetical protein